MYAETINVNGKATPILDAARKIATGAMFDHYTVDIGNVKCPVWPNSVLESDGVFVRFFDATGNVRAMIRFRG